MKYIFLILLLSGCSSIPHKQDVQACFDKCMALLGYCPHEEDNSNYICGHKIIDEWGHRGWIGNSYKESDLKEDKLKCALSCGVFK